MSVSGLPGLHSGHNPLVRIMLALAGLLTVSLAADWQQLAYSTVCFLVLTISLGLSVRPIVGSVRLMLPWTVLFFTIHVLFTWAVEPDRRFSSVLAGEAIILARFIGLSAVMGVLLVGMGAQRIVDSLKTLLDKSRWHSHRAEDLLQILRLILVFIPQVRREYGRLERFNRAFGFTPPANLGQRVRFYGANLLPVLSRSLARADQLGMVMDQRGYGRVVPRGQLTPVPFRAADTGWSLAIMLLMGGGRWLF